jgi:Lrp/AsnC family transcriptional regulator, regulator for asnA, asnC and gidA
MDTHIKLDMKNKRILRELVNDGRAPYSKVAKKVGLSKEVVHYRVNNLIKQGLLIGVNTVFNIKKIGMQIYFVHVRLKNVDSKNEDIIINSLVNHPNIAWVVKCIGNYDLILKFFVKDNTELNSVLKNLEKKYPYFNDFITDFTVQEHPIPIPYLYIPLNAYPIKKRNNQKVKIDELDLQIMELISIDARKQFSELSSILNIQRDTIKYRIKRLENKGVIVTYRPSAWAGTKSLGYSWYLLMLKFKQLDRKTNKILMTYLSEHINVAYIYELIGEHDLGFEIRLKTGDELNLILMRIKEILRSDFKSQELSLILKEYKYTYYTPSLKDIIQGV